MNTLLSVKNYRASFGKRTILDGVDLDIAEYGVLVLMGPCGTGKSTLLRSLAGLNDSSSLFSASGEVFYLGERIGECGRPVLVEQKPGLLVSSVFENLIANLADRSQLDKQQQLDLVIRLLGHYSLHNFIDLLEQQATELSVAYRRIIAILAAVINSPRLIMIDEPTYGLEEVEVKLILALIQKISESCSVIVILHNQPQAEELADEVVLLAGGKIQEKSTAAAFFNNPQSLAAREFIRTGSCSVPSPDTPPEHLDSDYCDRYQPVKASTPDTKIIPFGPRGFTWLERKRIAAMPRPGLLRELEHDLLALKKVGITHLVSLEEEINYPQELIDRHGFTHSHLPTVDMQPPSIAGSLQTISEIKAIIEGGGAVAVHCRAGLGRTGTLLACFLIEAGATVDMAITQVRNRDARMIQSRIQEEFITDFYQYFINPVHADGQNTTTPMKEKNYVT